jgi:hypothetical protein
LAPARPRTLTGEGRTAESWTATTDSAVVVAVTPAPAPTAAQRRQVGGGLGGSAHNAPATFSGGRGGGRGASLTDTYWGQPGQGGGAIALIALGELSISLGGIVSTGGAGGEAGRNTWAVRHEMSAGGGAGSGGLVVLEAPTVALSGVVAAHGGGGGQGAVCSDEANPLGCLGIGGARGYTTPSAKGGQRKVTDPNPAGTGSDAAGLSSAGSGASGSFAPSGGGGGAGFVVIRYADRPGAFTKEGTITPTVDGVTHPSRPPRAASSSSSPSSHRPAATQSDGAPRAPPYRRGPHPALRAHAQRHVP